jgi:Sulfatase
MRLRAAVLGGRAEESRLWSTIATSWDTPPETLRGHPPQKMCFSLLALIIAVCLLALSCGPPTGVLQAPDRPNVILILTDDLDARLLDEHLADYPNIRKLASEGTTFSNAFVTDPLCCPSRATILRG